MQVRKLLSWALAFMMVVSLTLAFSADLAKADDSTYTVRPGDNLTSIAAAHGVTVQDIAQANGISNVNNIYAGQVLKMPTANKGSANPAPVTTGEQAYLVQAGDTLTGIAAHFGVGIYDLAALNHLSVMSYIYTGQTLRIPQANTKQTQPTPTTVATTVATTTLPPTTTAAPTSTPTPAVTKASTGTSYTVQSGDNLSKIANQFGVTVDSIVQANHLSDPSLIFSGQVLAIPGANSGGAPANAGGQPAPTATPKIDTGAPAANPASQGKWIDVNLTKQTLVAYEGATPVFNSLVSTGVAWHPTVVGTFNIYVKYTSQAMTGGTGAEYYYLPNVPYVMYFYDAYALHGTYWHHNFGHPMSHGCVNLPTPAAQWLFNWAVVGTPVHIHY